MLANYHTHTPRCGHAVGTPQEYVETALCAGIKILGFSDHSPYPYENGFVSPIRMPMEELDDYCQELLAVKEQYGKRIELHIGLESEYYPRLFPLLLRRLREEPIEFLLLGQHFLGNEYGEDYVHNPTASEQMLVRYVDQCIEGMQTGVFTYLAHPDLIDFVGDPAAYDREMRRLCREATACGMPLEFNMNGYLQKRSYPAERFWRLAGEENAAVLLGADAHIPSYLDQPEAEGEARTMLARCGLTPIDTTPLRSF